MTRRIWLALFALLLAVPAAAQAPAGWQMRVDRSTNPSDPDDVPEVTVNAVAGGLEVFTGPAVTLWNPANTASGNYTLEGTFTLLEPSGHVNYYGLILGGSELDGAGQTYVYFLVAQNGSFIIRHRMGEDVHDVQGRTENEAVATPDANGQSVNRLQVRVGSEQVDFVVNGAVVFSGPRSHMGASVTDGVYGVRVNHVIPGVRVEGLGISR